MATPPYDVFVFASILTLTAVLVTPAATAIPVAPVVASIEQCPEVLGQDVHVYVTEIQQYASPDFDGTDGDYYLNVTIGNGQVMKSPTVIEGNSSDVKWHFNEFVSYDEPVWLPDGYGDNTVLAINFSLLDEDASSRYDELIIEHVERFDTDFATNNFEIRNNNASLHVYIESFEETVCANDIPGIVHNSTE